MSRTTIYAAALGLALAACSKSSPPSSDGTPGPHTIGGTVTGLMGTGLLLGIQGQMDMVDITGDGSFVFPDPLDDGTAYQVEVIVQPTSPDQTCTVTNASGTISGADVTNVVVTCTGVTELISGLYQRAAFTGRSDACGLLRSNADMTATLASVTMDAGGPGSIDFATSDFVALPYAAPTIAGTVTGTAFSAAYDDVFDVAGALMLPYDCTVTANYTVTGTVTSLGHAHANVSATASLSGPDCGAAQAEILSYLGGSGSFPCASSLGFDLTYAGPFPTPPVYAITSASMTGALLADPATTTPVPGTGTLDAVFEDVAVSESGASSCYAPGDYGTAGVLTDYAVDYRSADWVVAVSVAPSVWAAGGGAVDGSTVQVTMYRLSDNAAATAISGDVVLYGYPLDTTDTTPCNVQLSNVVLAP